MELAEDDEQAVQKMERFYKDTAALLLDHNSTAVLHHQIVKRSCLPQFFRLHLNNLGSANAEYGRVCGDCADGEKRLAAQDSCACHQRSLSLYSLSFKLALMLFRKSSSAPMLFLHR